MKKWYLAIFLSLAYVVVGIITLPDYGINWDAPYRMLRGQTNIQFLLSSKPTDQSLPVSPIIKRDYEFISRFDFLEGELGEAAKLPERVQPRKEFEQLKKDKQRRLSFYEDRYWMQRYWSGDRPGHPSLPDTLASFSNRVLFGIFGLVGDVESYQLIYILLSAAGVFVVTIFTYEIASSLFAATIAGVSLAFFPLFFAESHFNMKDPLQASMFAGAMWSFWHFIKSAQRRWLFGFFSFTAFALTVKWNIAFLPFIILPWLFLIRKTEALKKVIKLKWLVLSVFSGLLGTILVLIITEPFSWSNPIGYILNLIKFYFDTGTRPDPFQPVGFILPFGFNIYPILLLLTQTPEIILVLGLLGGIWVIRERGGNLKIGYLLLFWLLVPVLRVSLPHLWFYNGLRQIMEVLPAMAILSGIGANYTVSLLYGFIVERLKQSSNITIKQSTNKVLRVAIQVAVILLFIPVGLKIISIHPNENVYFNGLIGGLKGAVSHNLVDNKITYGNIYKQAADWINAHAERDANLAFLDGPMFALSPLFLRSDISISPYHFSGFEQKREYIVSLYNPNPESVFAALYPRTFLKPLHRIVVDGISLLTIYKNEVFASYAYKNSPEYAEKDVGSEQTKVVGTDFTVRRIGPTNTQRLEIDLGKPVYVTRIRLSEILPGCQTNYSQFIDEFIEFDSGIQYGLQERRKIGSALELWFPGEKTRYIKIYPQDQLSCFLRGKISSVSFLP